MFTDSLWLVGGGDRVTAAVVRALTGASHHVVLHTTRPTDLKTYSTVFDADLSQVELRVHRCRVKPLLSISGVRRYVNLACEFAVRHPMQGDVFVDLTPADCLGATYVRLPDIAYWNPTPDFREYLRHVLSSPMRRAFFTPYSLALTKLLDRMNKIPLNFVNSDYSEIEIRKCYGGRLHSTMQLLYPPVNIQAWRPPVVDVPRTGAISVARFSPWKRHDMQLQIVGHDIPLKMVGGARATLEIETVRTLRRARRDNVKIFDNLPFKELQQLLWTSKAFLHTADREPFGLSIVEAIAAGCIPVIRRCGGAMEVVPIRELTFSVASEARTILKRSMRGDFDHFLPQLQDHIRKFDEATFASRFLSAVERAGVKSTQLKTSP